MDQRLIVTLPFVAHLLGGAMLAIAYSAAEVTFTDGQLEFLLFVAYVGPIAAMGLVWLKNYVYGAPLLFISAGSGCWFAIYFFFVHANPANVAAASGDGARAYLYAAVVVVIGAFLTAGAGAWLWYRESAGFRSAIDSVVRPPDSSE